jgi:hypothetical protein
VGRCTGTTRDGERCRRRTGDGPTCGHCTGTPATAATSRLPADAGDVSAHDPLDGPAHGRRASDAPTVVRDGRFGRWLARRRAARALAAGGQIVLRRDDGTTVTVNDRADLERLLDEPDPGRA